MIRVIPLDVWAAVALAVAVLLAWVFDPIPAIFAGVFLGVCAYVAVQAFGGKLT